MNITHFDKIRINSESGVRSVFMDINQFPDGCSSGFMVTAYEIPSMPKDEWSFHKIEVRRKERQVALFTYRYSDAEIPEWWKDAEVLHSWEQMPKAIETTETAQPQAAAETGLGGEQNNE